MLDRPRSSVTRHFYRKVNQLEGQSRNIKRPKDVSPDVIDRIAQMRGEELSWKEIADSLGKPRQTVRNIYSRHVLDAGYGNYMQRNSTRWSTSLNQQLLHLRDDLAMPWQTIAQDMGKTEQSLQSHYYKLKGVTTMKPWTKKPWTTTEQQRLKELREGQSLKWKDVCVALPGRTIDACQQRYRDHVAKSAHSRSFTTLVSSSHPQSSSPAPLCNSGSLFGSTWRPTSHLRMAHWPRRSVHTAKATLPYGLRFTQEEDQLILQRRRELISFADIATELGRDSSDSVRCRFYRLVELGESGEVNRKNPLSTGQMEEVLRLRAAGVSWIEISQTYGRKRLAIIYQYKRTLEARDYPHLADLPDRKWTAVDVAILFDRRDRLDQNWSEIASALHRSPNAVQNKYYRVKMHGQPNRPTVRNGYTPEEDDTITYLREVLGYQWKLVQQNLPHRTLRSLWERTKRYKAQEERFTAETFALLHDLRNKQQLPWEDVQKRMPQWTISELQKSHEVFSKWPPPADFPLASSKQFRKLTTITESSQRFFGSFGRTLRSSPRPDTLWTTPTTFPRGQSRVYHVARSSCSGLLPSSGADLSKMTLRHLFPVSLCLTGSKAWVSSGGAAPPPVPKRTPYSDVEFRTIATMRQQGKPYREIAAELGRPSWTSIVRQFRQWAGKNGMQHLIQRKDPKAYQHEVVKEMRSRKESWRSISAQLGIHQAVLWRKHSEAEGSTAPPSIPPTLPRQREQWSDSEVQTLRHLHEVKKLSWVEIGERMGRSSQAAYRKYHITREISLAAVRWSPEESKMLKHLRDDEKLPWKEIKLRMPHRTTGSLWDRYARYKSVAEAQLRASKGSDPGSESQKD